MAMSDNGMKQSDFERPDSIKEALTLLDRAIAGQSAKLEELVTNDYAHLKGAMAGMAASVTSTESASTGNPMKTLTDAFNAIPPEYFDRASELARTSFEKGREVYTEADQQLRKNPWPVLGGIAVGTFALGLLIGRNSSRDSRSQELADRQRLERELAREFMARSSSVVR